MDSATRRWEEYVVYEVWLIGSMIAFGVMQATLLPAPFGYTPALVLVIVVCQSLLSVQSLLPDQDAVRTLRRAIYGGLTLDMCGAAPIGSHVVALLLAATLVMATTRRLQIGGVFLPLVAAVAGGVVYEIVLALIYHVTRVPLMWNEYTVQVVLPSIVMSLVLVLPTFYLLRWRAAGMLEA